MSSGGVLLNFGRGYKKGSLFDYVIIWKKDMKQ